jgi:hypothetical protein
MLVHTTGQTERAGSKAVPTRMLKWYDVRMMLETCDEYFNLTRSFGSRQDSTAIDEAVET